MKITKLVLNTLRNGLSYDTFLIFEFCFLHGCKTATFAMALLSGTVFMSLFGISSLMCNAVGFHHKSKISLNKFGLAFFES